jgi:hypothetical protein
MKAIMRDAYITDLAVKTRRGQLGRVRVGAIPGGRSFDFDMILPGEERGRRVINGREAAIIRRFFTDYAAACSPRSTIRDHPVRPPADIIDYCASIHAHDPNFFKVFVAEKELILTRMLEVEGSGLADHVLFKQAWNAATADYPCRAKQLPHLRAKLRE